MAEKEKIVAAAIKLDADVYSLVPPARHHDIIRMMVKEGLQPLSRGQGFLTNTGRFVDRVEAAQIAYTSGQTKSLVKLLMSEDLW